MSPRHVGALGGLLLAAAGCSSEEVGSGEPSAAGSSGAGGGEEGGAEVGGEQPSFVQGARLRMRELRAPGGVAVPVDLFDTELGVACAFRRTSAGWRCLPRAAEVGFADAACSQPVAAPACDGDHAVIVELDRNCGGTPPEVLAYLPSGEPRRGPTWLAGTTSCLEDEVAAPIVPLTPTSPDAFVGAALVDDTVDGVEVRRIDADDGTSIIVGVGHAGQPCSPARVGDVVRCVDERAAYAHDEGDTQFFADPECATPAATWQPNLCAEAADPEPRLAAWAAEGTAVCPEAPLFLVGAWGDAAWNPAEGTCAPWSMPVIAAPLRRRVDVEDFPEMTVTRRREGPSIVEEVSLGGVTAYPFALVEHRTRALVPEVWVPWRVLRDDAMGFACAIRMVTGGAIRCVPDGRGFVAPFYADPACTEPLLEDDEEVCGLVVSRRFHPVTDAPGDACRGSRWLTPGGEAPVREVWERGAVHTGLRYRVEGDVCVPSEDPRPLFHRARVVSASDLPALVGPE